MIGLTDASKQIDLDQVKMKSSESSSVTVSLDGSANIQSCEFSLPLVIESGEFTFTDCCFQGAGENVHYISSQSATRINFVEPICFDKSKENSLSIQQIPENSKETMFNCDVCGEIPDPVTSEYGETFESEELSESEDQKESTSEAFVAESETRDVEGNEDTKDKKLEPGIIAAIAVASIAVVVAIVLVIVFLILRKKKSDSFDDDLEMFDDDSSITTETIETAATTDQVESPQLSNPLFSVPVEDDEFSNCFEEATED